MNDALRQELALAVRCFAEGTTADARRAIVSARQLDRAGEVERRLRLLEVACLIRDQDTASAEALLNSMGRLGPEEWAYLDRLLMSAPERQFAGFERYRLDLRARMEARSVGTQALAVPTAAAPVPIQFTPGVAAQPMEAKSGGDGMAITALILGIVSILASVLGCFCGILGGTLSLVPGVVGIVLAANSTRRGGLRTAGLAVSIVGTALSLVTMILWIAFQGMVEAALEAARRGY